MLGYSFTISPHFIFHKMKLFGGHFLDLYICFSNFNHFWEYISWNSWEFNFTQTVDPFRNASLTFDFSSYYKYNNYSNLYICSAGSVELAAVGVSISVFNLVSKLFNVPLLNITTSFVAEEQALVGENENNSLRIDTSINSVLMFPLQRHADYICVKMVKKKFIMVMCQCGTYIRRLQFIRWEQFEHCSGPKIVALVKCATQYRNMDI